MKIKESPYLFKINQYKKFFIAGMITIFFLSPGAYLAPSLAQTVEQTINQNTTTFDGQILFAPMESKITYLIDNTGVVNHTWSSDYLPGVSVHWLGNGMILRTIKSTGGISIGGGGGGIQKVEWDGTVVWDFRYNTNGVLSHHDLLMLPNGNVLLIAWETKTPAEAIAVGRNPDFVSSAGFMPDHIIEVQPTGSTSGTIVWEWHVWDHLIQDYDASKANYGAVGNHPELVDINYVTFSDFDWLHTNSIDYNEEFDQILISVCYFNEIWVIDHSTTTAEAAGHTGGNSGKGGDLLYRWGNPAAYRVGASSDQKFFQQHDATWIHRGCPGAGNILVFNNGVNRFPPPYYSSVDEIVPPVDENGEYYLQSGSAYEPTALAWRYTASPPESFYSGRYSSAERLTDGSTLICNGQYGDFFRVSSTGTTLWTYHNPYPHTRVNGVFKIDYIPSDEESPNQPPYTPRFPAPANGTTDVSVNIELRWTGGDPDGDPVKYDVYFGTTSSPLKMMNNQSTLSYTPGTLTYDTTYYWQIVAWDSNGTSTVGPLWQLTTKSEGNNPPNTPTINGETDGTIRTMYYYTILTTDPDQDAVKYYIDWGDDTTTTTGFYESGDDVFVSHTWKRKGTYSVKAKAIDGYSAESNWGILTITMPYTYDISFMRFWTNLLERFPNAFLLLQQLLGE